jgi:phage anti-repressor protein
MAQYGLVEGRDYMTVTSFPRAGEKSWSSVDYYATLVMGKELAILQNNDRGHMLRRYPTPGPLTVVVKGGCDGHPA